MEVFEPEAKVIKQIFNMYLSDIGSVTIANRLNLQNISSPGGNEWTPKTITEILKNEKYMGDMLLQKFYIKDHLSKKEALNKGELPQYYVENSHKGIISRENFQKVQEKFKARPRIDNTPKEYEFRGIVFCGICGCHYVRKKNHEKYVWRCNTFQNQGKAKQVPDNIIKEIAKDFNNEISKIIVLPNNKLQFIFTDGSELKTFWEQSSRKDNWTPEMKEKARQQALKRNRGEK